MPLTILSGHWVFALVPKRLCELDFNRLQAKIALQFLHTLWGSCGGRE